MLLQQILNGIIVGAAYSLIALGLNLIWSIARRTACVVGVQAHRGK